MQRTRLFDAIATCAQTPQGGTAVAACFFELSVADPSTNFVEIQVTPAGAFRPRDGREMKVDAWRMDAAIAARVIARFQQNQTPPVVDYEHQTLEALDNGQPAPAAGFIRSLEWRDGAGLFAQVELTSRARQFVADGEYRYFSPVFSYDQKTGEVTALLMGALTNNPALDGMAAIAARAAARFQTNHGEPQMNKHLLALCVALGLSIEGKDEAQLETAGLTAITALKSQPDKFAKLRADLGLGEATSIEDISTAVVALKSKANGNPDPAKFVGVEVVDALRQDIAKLTASQQSREIDELVGPALEDGRLLPAQEQWARDLGKTDIAALRKYLDTATPIAALRGTQTRGSGPTVDTANEHGLTAGELAVCAATGIAAKDFAAAKPTR
jgi:phage I-like protein